MSTLWAREGAPGGGPRGQGYPPRQNPSSELPLDVDLGRIEAPRPAERLRALEQGAIVSRPDSPSREAWVQDDLHDHEREDRSPPAEVSRIPGLPQGHPRRNRGQRAALLQPSHASLNRRHGVLDLGLDRQELPLLQPQGVTAPPVPIPAGLLQPLLVLTERRSQLVQLLWSVGCDQRGEVFPLIGGKHRLAHGQLNRVSKPVDLPTAVQLAGGIDLEASVPPLRRLLTLNLRGAGV